MYTYRNFRFLCRLNHVRAHTLNRNQGIMYFRMVNDDVIDLYSRVQVGATVIVKND